LVTLPKLKILLRLIEILLLLAATVQVRNAHSV
jgi:hypothetical protein